MRKKQKRYVLLIILLLCSAFKIDARATSTAQKVILLKKREALVWHLGHSGWAIKTQNHVLIFDYSGRGKKIANPAKTFGLENRNLFVFVSHDHGDHFDPGIFEWEKVSKNIYYIIGWNVIEEPNVISLGPRRERKIGNVEILTIDSTDRGVGFLVKVDGLFIFHAGDFENGEGFWEFYVKEVDFIRENLKMLDMAFIPVARNKGEWWTHSNKGSFYLIETLSPKVVFPMHALGQEQFYKEFASEAVKRQYRTFICCAEKPGDHFLYQKGKIIQ